VLGDHKQEIVIGPVSGSGHAQQLPQNCTLESISKGELYEGCTAVDESTSTGKPEACRQLCVSDSSDTPLGKGCAEQQRGDTIFQFLALIPQVRDRGTEKQPEEKKKQLEQRRRD